MRKRILAILLVLTTAITCMPLMSYASDSSSLESAWQVYQSSKASLDSANSALADGQTKRDAAKTALDSAENALNTANSNLASKESELSAAESALNQANTELANAQADVNQKQATVDALEAEKAVAIENAQAAYDEAKEASDNSVIGFLDANAPSTLEAILTSLKNNDSYSGYMNDAFYNTLNGSLTESAFLNSLSFIRKTNELRKSEDLRAIPEAYQELRTSYRLAYYAAIANAFNRSGLGVHGYDGISETGYCNSEIWSSTSNCDISFRMWYTNEKASYESYLETYPDMANKSAYQIYASYQTVYYSVGHYLNIVEYGSRYNAVGYAAYNGSTGNFGYDANAITVDEMESAYNAFVAPLKENLANAEADLTAANTDSDELAAARVALSNANATLEQKKSNYDSAKSAYDNAKTAVESAKSEANAAKKTYDAAKADFDAKEAKVKELQNAANNAQSEYQKAYDAVEAIGHYYDEGVVTKNATKNNRGEITYTCKVCGETKIEYFDYIEASGISLSDSEISLMTSSGKNSSASTKSLTATITPSNATDKSITWTSSNEKVATVDSKGKITALRYGTATITATTADGAKATCVVNTMYYDVFVGATDSNGENEITQNMYNSILWLADKGITRGYDDVYFGTHESTTRAAFVMFLWRYAGQPSASATSKFPDVKVGQSGLTANMVKAINWATSAGIINGFSDGTFRPTESVTRAQVCIMLWKYAGRPQASTLSTTSKFSDVKVGSESLTANMVKAINWCNSKKIVNGYTSGTYKGKFLPSKDCMRCHISYMLYKYDLAM